MHYTCRVKISNSNTVFFAILNAIKFSIFDIGTVNDRCRCYYRPLQ